tara:strand:- start:341 stop:1375 length:1035 start_codon:yes stop_codon:yes gene_type:complete
MEMWAMAQKEFIENKNPTNLTFKVLQQTGINPMYQVDINGKIVDFKNHNGAFGSDSIKLYENLEKIKKENNPILIQYRDSLTGRLLVNQKLYYGDSKLLKQLKYYPIALLLIIMLFGLLIFFIFKTNKISEQNRLWASMAKETAHQIGTPLSSLIGWTTLIKEGHLPKLSIEEMENDINRLKVITERFSKIGSNPVLEFEDLVLTINETVEYLKKRTSNLILFKLKLSDKPLIIPINKQLLSWTLENLIKNGIDAMKGKGEINIYLEEKEKFISILISDHGEGIKSQELKKIFNPGFTSKKRGWGMGLSLAKRIVEDYHGGKIYVKKTTKTKGTTFALDLIKAT